MLLKWIDKEKQQHCHVVAHLFAENLFLVKGQFKKVSSMLNKTPMRFALTWLSSCFNDFVVERSSNLKANNLSLTNQNYENPHITLTNQLSWRVQHLAILHLLTLIRPKEPLNENINYLEGNNFSSIS